MAVFDDTDLSVAGALPADPSTGAEPMEVGPSTPSMAPTAASVVAGPLDLDDLAAALKSKGGAAAFTDKVKTAAARLDRGQPEYHLLRDILRPYNILREWDQAVDVVRTELRVAAAKAKAAGSTATPVAATKYKVVDGRLCHLREDDGGVVSTPLCNFNARITEEIVADDGVETTRHLVVAGRIAGSTAALPAATIPASDFPRVSTWALTHWGAAATVGAGAATHDQLREALQVVSSPKLRRVYKHTGWRTIDGIPTYLFNGGSIGAPAEVALDGALSRYRLPTTDASPDELRAAVDASLSILRLAPLAITGPLIAAVGLAPLASIVPIDLTLWIQGRSGSFKSEVAALLQSHWGRFGRTDLPGNWTSTANALEAALFIAKDALYTIDDYAPQGSLREQSDLERRAATILRNQGNRQARGRLRHDLTARPDRPPRGLLLSTAELSPPAGSVASRVVIVSMDRTAISTDELTRLQSLANLLPVAMRGYISWLAPQLDALAGTITGELAGLRNSYTAEGQHARAPDALAKLHLGIATYLRFAVACGARDPSYPAELLAAFTPAVLGLSAVQSMAAHEAQPGVRFLRVLGALLTQGRVALQPDLQRDLSSVDTDRMGNERTLAAEYVGWADAHGMRGQTPPMVYLDPDLSLRAVARFFRDAGEHWPVASTRALADVLVDAGAITRAREGGQYTATRRRMLAQVQRRVFEVSMSALMALP